MIPVLYAPDSLINLHGGNAGLGLGFLTDCISATVTEERNGMFELQIEYPVNGILFDKITYCSWIVAKPYVGGNDQIFRVYKISKPLNGRCMIYAEHVSYLLSYAVVSPVNLDPGHGVVYEKWPGNKTCSEILTLISNNIMDITSSSGITPFSSVSFTFTDKKASISSKPFAMTEPKSVREYLLDDKWSILSVYGDGEFKFDNFDVYFYDSTGANARGRNNGIKIQYGNNLTNLSQDISDESIITGFYPYWQMELTSGDWGGVAIRDIPSFDISQSRIVLNPAAVAYFDYYPRIIPLDITQYDEWKELPNSASAFTDAVNKYISENLETVVPIVNLDVSYVDLGQTEEYKDKIPFNDINLCDTVTVTYPKYGIDAEMKVTKTEYNVLEERYNKITLGSTKMDLSRYLVKGGKS